MAFKNYLSAKGITHRFSCPHTPQQNGKGERKIRHVVEIGLALLAHASLPSKFWMKLFQPVVYLINLLPTKVIHYQTPLQILFHKILNYNHLHIFGCLYFPFLHPWLISSLIDLFLECSLAMPPSHKGYLCFYSKFGHFYVSRNVLFFEESFPFKSSLPTTSSSKQLTSTPPDAPSAPSFSCSSKPLPSLILVPFLSSNFASPLSPINTHHMVTRAKSGIQKKKAYLTQLVFEPRSYT